MSSVLDTISALRGVLTELLDAVDSAAPMPSEHSLERLLGRVSLGFDALGNLESELEGIGTEERATLVSELEKLMRLRALIQQNTLLRLSQTESSLVQVRKIRSSVALYSGRVPAGQKVNLAG